MLSEIAAEVLRFLSRRDLDKASAVSKWLDAMIAQFCDVYPLRSVAIVTLYPSGFRHVVEVHENERSATGHRFCFMDEAVHFAGSVLRNSYVDLLQRLRSSSIRAGSLQLHGAARQRVTAYAPYITPGGMYGTTRVTYRFPLIDEDNKNYEVALCERFAPLRIRFQLA